MENSYTEYRIGKAIVRVHPGKLTEEERRVVWEDATRKFLKEVLRHRKQQEKKREPE